MTGTTGCLRRELELDFAGLCGQLAEARLRLDHKDSTSNRASVAECRARIDAVLDLHLDAEGRGGPPPHDGGGGMSVARSQAAVRARVVDRANSGPS